MYCLLYSKLNDASVKFIQAFPVSFNNGKGTLFTLGKPICGYDIVNYDYVSFVAIQKHTDGYVVKIITCSQNTNSSNDSYNLFDFKLQGGNANIWYI